MEICIRFNAHKKFPGCLESLQLAILVNSAFTLGSLWPLLQIIWGFTVISISVLICIVRSGFIPLGLVFARQDAYLALRVELLQKPLGCGERHLIWRQCRKDLEWERDFVNFFVVAVLRRTFTKSGVLRGPQESLLNDFI